VHVEEGKKDVGEGGVEERKLMHSLLDGVA